MKKILKIGLTILAFILVIYYLMFYVLSGVKTPFAKACYGIKVGMEKETVLRLMSDFENKEEVIFQEKDGVLAYVTPGLSGDYQCYVYLAGGGTVKSVVKIFD